MSHCVMHKSSEWCLQLQSQAAGYSYDESLGRVLPTGMERELKEKGGVTELPPSKVCCRVFCVGRYGRL